MARGAVDVMVAIWNHETRDHSLALASELRRSGLRVDVYPEADKIGKQFKYASSRSVPFVALLGDDERARGEVAVKDLRTGDQQERRHAARRRAFVKRALQNPSPRRSDRRAEALAPNLSVRAVTCVEH